MTQPIVNIEHLTFCRGTRKIFDDISMSIQPGKVIAIMGPSGTGKTTLLNLITGQIKPKAGAVEAFGHNVPNLSRSKLYDLRRRMGMMFQNNALFTNLTVYDNVAYPLRERPDLSETLIRDIVLMKLEAVGLRGARDLMPNELSGGMARRVALARTIAMDPELLLYDEPFTGQDPISCGMITKLVRQINDAMGITSLIVSHDVEIIMNLADYVYVLADGKIASEGDPSHLRDSNQPQVKQFLQGLPDGPVPFHFPAQTVEADFLGEGDA
ncbi:MAG: ABC transporter ATP-binding protein [Gammaproteobacteria bacterium]